MSGKMLRAPAKRASKKKMKVSVKPIIKKTIISKKVPATKTQAVEVVVSFDTTGSMRAAIAEVRAGVRKLLDELFHAVPKLRMGIIAHGDYCDRDTPGSYVTKEFNLSTDKASIKDFLHTCSDTGGGDAPECYELVLNKACSFRWAKDSKKVLVLIGDDIPHHSTDRQNYLHLDWREEAKALKEKGVQIIAVQALGNSHARAFYSELASITGGYHLELSDFKDVPGMIQGVVRFQQGGAAALKDYSNTLIASGLMTRGLSTMYGCLAGVKTLEIEHGCASSDKFKVLDVHYDARIDTFVAANRLRFERGNGYYQFTKSEEIQGYKKVILMNKLTGEIFTDTQARKIMGLPNDGKTAAKARPDKDPQYLCFVQSTSNNRVLKAGTKFLYEVG